MKYRPASRIEWLDRTGHRLHLPRFVMRPICYRFDRSLGMTEAEARS